MAGEHDEAARTSVIIRSPPKFVFLYPTFLAAIAAGVWTYYGTGDDGLYPMGPGRLRMLSTLSVTVRGDAGPAPAAEGGGGAT